MTRLRLLPLLLLATPAFAQSASEAEPRPEGRVLYQKETQIDFDILALDGVSAKPGVLLSSERAQARFNPLIVIRSDFDAEMLRDAEAVR